MRKVNSPLGNHFDKNLKQHHNQRQLTDNHLFLVGHAYLCFSPWFASKTAPRIGAMTSQRNNPTEVGSTRNNIAGSTEENDSQSAYLKVIDDDVQTLSHQKLLIPPPCCHKYI
jgi:hypothetical protein